MLAFEFRLARGLQRSRAELLSSLDNDEFNFWLALEQLDPLPDQWITNAMQCQVMANLWRGKGKSYKLSDFMPVKPAKKPQTETQLKSMFRGMMTPQH